jgi:hypothetical protein
MIPPEEIEAGLVAYEQVQAFAALRRKRLPVVYACFPVLLLVAGAVLAAADWLAVAAVVAAIAIAFALFARWNWRRLRALDASNRARLAQLHGKYGDDLPWLQVERQLAEIRKIEAERAGWAPDEAR